MLVENTYISFINNIIYTKGNNDCVNGYFERRHIISKYLGGSNDENKPRDLYAEEHFHAHKLLTQEYPENEKLVNAYAMMTFTKNEHQERIELSSEDYSSARKTFSQLMKKKWQDENYRNMQSNNLIKRWETSASDELKIQKSRVKKLSSKLWSNPGYIKQHRSPVHCLETNEYFFKQQDACTKYNINSTSISNCLKGKQKFAGKHPVTSEKLHEETYYENTTSICENKKNKSFRK